ncbi:hypothetical protein PLESTB_000630000 [Pleodorina starrii]|uniref:KOW domain-containing protein n=1 Tax=Pleodorina starrii TaxID=330485 RepID=A0A9W6BJ99_9CHLO|nr:hypothetical protein PLESTM_001290700 [Pleodorina starrii]GLC52446.1 hypothetical protein PLESTB_000630000 [Pleodorina starrii]GLC69693.1 hypothetical protein PLESTF_000867100 [Pleodorina starrii]
MPQLLRAIRPMFKTDRWRICRDDIVYILSGPDKGKTGKVLEVFKDPRVPRVIVEGRNLRKKKVRTGPGDDDYFVVTMEAPLHYSQVQVADPDTGRPVRVVFKYTPDGQMVRARKVPNPTVNDIIPTPPPHADPRAGLVGRKDTPADVARQGSYVPAEGFPYRIRNLERIWAGMHPDQPPAGEDGAGQGSGSSSGSAARRVLFTAPSAGGARGLCTMVATPDNGASCAGRERERASGGVGREGDAAAGPAVSVTPLAASFALSGLRRQRRLPLALQEQQAEGLGRGLGSWVWGPGQAGGPLLGRSGGV